ncbi:hypothetical protein [Rhizobium sp. 2MFCol3.1]|uniref:hypothetical protein n=1 Tax=Rhizobium sp. 2MFCol3.1 TaxID=1246459 RepID=UPI000381A90B|nr:hypothetical protein [Rhizobium sp. 2MFCol3.1]
MSTITIVIIAGAVLSTLYFAAGYLRGVQNAIADFRNGKDDEGVVPQHGHWIAIALAFLTSIISIVGIGYASWFIYVGPFLVLVTTLGVGLAFFVERRIDAATKVSTRQTGTST